MLDSRALDLLLLALTDERHRRRLIGRLRPRLVGRPHPIVRFPRRRRPGLLPSPVEFTSSRRITGHGPP
jgi:hypothetical protein